MRKRLSVWILLLCLLTVLPVGCGADRGGAKEAATADRSDTVYTTEYLSFDAQVDEVVDSALDGTAIYLLGDRYLDGGDSFCLLRLPLDGGELEELPDYAPVSLPEGTEGYVYAVGLFVGTDETLWVREVGAYFTYDLPEDFNPETQNKLDYRTGMWELDILRKLDQTGAELRRIDVTAVTGALGIDRQQLMETMAGISPILYSTMDAGGYILDFALDSEGHLYLLTLGTLYVLDDSLELLFKLDWEGVAGNLIALGDGTLAMQRYLKGASWNDLTGFAVCAVDLAARDWGKVYSLTGEASAAWSGIGDWLFFYTGGGSLYAWNAAADVETRLTVWDTNRINPALLTQCILLPDGRIAALLDRNGMPEAAILTEADQDSPLEAATLTYAVLSSNAVDWDAVNNFNRTHTDVQIEVKDYSVYDTDGAVGAHSGMDQLLLEIAAGDSPDIVSLSYGDQWLPYRQMAKKGYFEDLWPYIENDPDLGGESLMEAPLKAAEVDGGLYMAFNAVCIETLVGAERVVGDRRSWSLEDLQLSFAKMPEGSTVLEYYYTKQTMFYYILRMSLDGYVDWEEGRCSFDSEEFRTAMEFVNSYPMEFNWTSDTDVSEESFRRLLGGEQMLSLAFLSGLDDIQKYDAVFGDRASFAGFPVEDDSAGSCFIIGGGGIAIFSACRNKEAAWEFIRQEFLPRITTTEDLLIVKRSIPVNRSDFERIKEWAMTRDEEKDGDQFIQVIDTVGPLKIEHHMVTEDEYERFMSLFNSVEKIALCDQTIYDIVQELCTPYFAGDRTLDETIRLIQDQVGLYVMEQK